ncbi:hypothetical protein V6N13_149675 [Hibiscus sabdariffa]|uniref:Uncharacterized protein n=2 Tax=Hibiscus sabdariffa TaxID=183260 RepID=A0ABR2EGN3_9ROSI
MAAQATKMFSKKLTDNDVKKRPLVCTVRKKGYKKPVFSGRLWTDFVICKKLNVGDGISLHKVEDEDGSSHYRVEVEKQDEAIVPK